MPISALQQVTPVILTYNEESNIGRTLDSVCWAPQVIVVDSGSTDQTETTARSFANVKWLVRPFDTHRSQWQYGITETGIDAEYVLALDADMEVPEPFLKEMETHFLPGQFDGGVAGFEYRYYGRRLSGSLCPPQLRLFRRSKVNVSQTNHTQVFSVDGRIYRFRNSLIHDDRKPLPRWITAQLAYQKLNELELRTRRRPRFRDFIRRMGIMPPLAGALAYLKAGGPFGGAAAARYAYERSVTEGLLAIMLMDRRLKDRVVHETVTNHSGLDSHLPVAERDEHA